jgi:hypothetical protein
MPAPLIRPNTCSTCALKERERDLIYCRAHPPMPYPIIIPLPNGQIKMGGDVALFPTVKPDWWCGEHTTTARAEVSPLVSGR